MGNKASSALPSYDVIVKRFSAKELDTVNEMFHVVGKRIDGSPGVPKDVFLAQHGEGLGWAGMKALSRLFKVMDANGTGALEFEEYVTAAFFFFKASRVERLKVLFAMFDPLPSGHWGKGELSTFCFETTMALTEHRLNDMPEGQQPREEKGAPHAFPSCDGDSTPSKELAAMMADIVMIKYDVDRDGKLSLSEFSHYSQQANSGVDELVEIISLSRATRALADALAATAGTTTTTAVTTRVAA